MRKIAIIGGSGVYTPKESQKFTNKEMNTPYGMANYSEGMLAGNLVVFMNRHGAGHSVPPHMVNYRANIWALKKIGVQDILATAAVGSCNPEMMAGDFVICDQILDFTKNRINTFYDGVKFPVGHADFTNPYCPTLRLVVEDCCEKIARRFHNHGTMVVTEGPRFETPAEIKMFKLLGGDVINMTGMPEAILAREAEMHYASVAIVTNQAAGISEHELTHDEVLIAMKQSGEDLSALIDNFISYSKEIKRICKCETAMADYGGFKI